MKHHTLLKFISLAFIVAVVVVLALPSGGQAADGYQIYIVKPGDRLASIARMFCSTWQEIYTMNQGVIGPDPNQIYPGMQLKVIDHCQGPGGCYGVYDRGPSLHASGAVYGNRYHVVHGDTWYSISRRFGVAISVLQSANGMTILYAGTVITIPCLGYWPPLPPPPPPIPPQPVYVNINHPAPNSVLPDTFQVDGDGAGLFEGNVLVRAIAEGNILLDEEAVVMSGPEVGTGGYGTWSVTLHVSVAPGTPGTIQASSPPGPAFASVPVIFGTGGGDHAVYPPGQCNIGVKNGTKAYESPGGTDVAQFVSTATLNALERQTVSSMDWYRYEMVIDSVNRSLWSPANELASIGAGCT